MDEMEPKLSPLKVLVVGGAGYIGSHVTHALVKAGHQPTVFDNLSTGLRENLLPGVPFIHGDILFQEHLDSYGGFESRRGIYDRTPKICRS
jgi:UDP-glucose 4-epimerase